jgi:hypothetical protein
VYVCVIAAEIDHGLSNEPNVLTCQDSSWPYCREDGD